MTVQSEEIRLSLWALQMIVDTTWEVAQRQVTRDGSVGLAAGQREAKPLEPHAGRCEMDSVPVATPEPMSGGTVAGEDRLPCGVAPTAGPVASMVQRWHDECSEITGYGIAQRRAYSRVLRLLGDFDKAQDVANKHGP